MARRRRRRVGGGRRKTYKKKSSARKAARGRPVYKVRGGYRVGRRRRRR